MKNKFSLYVLFLLLITFTLFGCSTSTNSTHYNPSDVKVNASEESVTEGVLENNITAVPSNEQIMEELVNYSNARIDQASESDWNEEISSIYFFEEGKYASKIYSGIIVDEAGYRFYRCIVETTRTFNLVDVTETLLISLFYNEETSTWHLYQAIPIQLTGDWKIANYWTLPDSGAMITFSDREYIDINNGFVSELYSYNYTQGDRSWDGYLCLYLPTSSNIYSSAMTGPDGRGIERNSLIELDITPDSVWYTEPTLGNHARLDETTLGVGPTVLSTTGIIDMATDEAFLPYMDAANNIANIVFVEHDISKLTEEYLFSGDTNIEELNQLSEYLKSNNLVAGYVTPYMGIAEEEYNGITPIVYYVIIALPYDGVYQFETVGIYLFEQDGKIGLLAIDT